MWVLIKCDDSTIGQGHDEERRILFPGEENIKFSPFNGIILPTTGIEVHPYTPGEEGYHCQICHKDIKGKPQSEEDIIESIKELRKEFEDMATKKMFIMTRSKKTGGIGGEYTSPNTFCLWAGYWECAIRLGIIPDKIEYINEG